jgi:microcystin degradation protein MlrC
MPVDAVFLSMHGAMVAEGYDDCESDLLAHVRKVVGPDMPVGVELDLHCNLGAGTFRDATALVLFKEYPASRRVGPRRRPVHRDGRRDRGPHQGR